MVLKDCSRVLTANTQSQKALYRSARALVALERYPEARDCCDRIISLDPTNGAAHSLRTKVLLLQKTKEDKEMARQRQMEAAKLEKRRLQQALKVSSMFS